MQSLGDSPSLSLGFLGRADARLLERSFTIEDPSTLPDLAQAIPPSEPSPHILFKYDTKASGRPKLRCAHCKGARHWKGYVVQLASGQSALIAERQCGRDAFGLKWDAVESQFNGERDRQLDLQRLLLVEPLLAPLISELQACVMAGNLDGHGRYLADLRTRFGLFGQALAKMARHGGQLEATHWVRNRAKEEDRVRKLRPDLIDDVEEALELAYRQRARKILDRFIEDNCKVEEPTQKILGQCRGWTTFIPGPTSKTLLAQALAALIATRKALDDAGAPGKLGPLLKEIATACEDITRALELARELERFVAWDNLEQIAQWVAMDGSLRFAFQVEGSTLLDKLTGNRLALDDAWSIPAMVGLDRMKGALEASA